VRLTKALPEQKVFFDPETATWDARFITQFSGAGGITHLFSRQSLTSCASDSPMVKLVVLGLRHAALLMVTLAPRLIFTLRRVLLGAQYIMPRLFLQSLG